MTIPQYQKLMRPVLWVLEDGRDREISVMREEIATALRLTKTERSAVTEEGRNLYDSRVGYAAKYLREAICCRTVRRGLYRITDRGSSLLKERPTEISNDDLKRYPEFRKWLVRSRRTKRT
jgi:restriction system protein